MPVSPKIVFAKEASKVFLEFARLSRVTCHSQVFGAKS